ncbi:MAG: hypothetical protein ACYDAO_06030 [Thermoplasmataceae archaeon]
MKAIRNVFPGIPIRICLMHFLRDLGKDLMGDMHTDLGIMINRKGIKSRIKAIFRDLPEYDMKCILDLESGFCTDTPLMEMMCIRRVLEPLMNTRQFRVRLSLLAEAFQFPQGMRECKERD